MPINWYLPLHTALEILSVCAISIVLVLMVRYWVPESPRWLMQKGRHEEARKSLAWALMVDPKEIDLPTTGPEGEKLQKELTKKVRDGIDEAIKALAKETRESAKKPAST